MCVCVCVCAKLNNHAMKRNKLLIHVIAYMNPNRIRHIEPLNQNK